MKRYLLLLIFVSGSAFGNSLNGHFKSQGVLSEDSFSSRIDNYLWNNQVAVKGLYDLSKQLMFEGSYQLDLRYEKRYRYSERPQNAIFPYRSFDLDIDLYDKDFKGESSLHLFQNINRFNLSYSTEKYEIIAGRQSVSFGSGRVVSPIDIWAPFGISEIDTEDRLGVDSLRVKTALGEMGQIDMGLVISNSDDNERIHSFFDLKISQGSIDYELNLSRFHRNYLTGLGAQGDLLGAGIWLEGAYYFMNDIENYFRITGGAEYSFNSTLLGSLEYHYNGAGESNHYDYLSNLVNNDAYREGAVFFLGKNYIIPGVSWMFHPLASLSSNIIVNLSDMSQYYSLKFEYNLAEDLYLDCGMYISASSGEKSEYSRYSDTIYSSFRSYF